MSLLRQKPLPVMLICWGLLIGVAALSAIGSIRNLHISSEAAVGYFLTTVAGPTLVFFNADASMRDCAFAVVLGLGLLAVTLVYYKWPGMVNAWVFLLSMMFWFLMGMGAAYAWV